MSRKRPKFLYAIQEAVNGPIKIGVAVDPKKRLQDLSTGNPRRLLFLGARELSRDAEVAEHEIRQRFQAFQLTGEWYEAAGEFKAFVETFFVMGRPAPWLEPDQ